MSATTKLDLILERIRELPLEAQEALAEEIEFRLNQEGASLLTDEQWAEVDAALADDSESASSHEEVFARLRERRK